MSDDYFILECRDQNNRITFSSDIRTIRVTARRTIASGETGSMPLTELPSGLEGVALMPVNAGGTGNIAPYTWTAGGQFHWRGGAGAYYLMVLNIAGLGGNLVPDGDSE